MLRSQGLWKNPHQNVWLWCIQNKKCMCLHTIKFLSRRRPSGDLKIKWLHFSEGPVKYQYNLKMLSPCQTPKEKLFTKLYFCLGVKVQSLFCVHLSNSSANVYLLLCCWWSICHPITYKGSCSANSQETLNWPIHLNGQYNCCVFSFYFKIIKIYTNMLFFIISIL